EDRVELDLVGGGDLRHPGRGHELDVEPLVLEEAAVAGHEHRQVVHRVHDRQLGLLPGPGLARRFLNGHGALLGSLGVLVRHSGRLSLYPRAPVAGLSTSSRSGSSSAASAAFATITSSSILAPPAATAPTTWPATTIGKPPGTLVKSPSMRICIDS